MKRLYKRKEPPGAVLEDHSVVQEALVPSMTVFKRAKQNIGTRCHNYRGEKVYLGVRVRMPVRDLLKNIRGSRGVDDLNKGSKKGSGDMKRARPRSRTKATRGEHPVKSLEELATILEVLEDDLRTSCASHSPSQNVPSPDFSAFREPSPTDVIHGDEYDQTTPSPEYYTEFSPSTPEYDVAWSRPDCMFFSLQPSCVGDMQIHSDREQDWFNTKHNLDLNSSAFFWTQLQQEEGWLRAASDAELLTTDEQGRTLLHRVVCVGKRAQAYAIAKRMAVINSLDLKDSSGMTALLYAANHNQHLIVADLIQLGANINQRNNLGKSCLHLSAENGYIRVLEVLKQQMMNGLYIDVEATDNSGMTVLQCASVALKTSMSEVDSRTSLSHNRLHTLRLEHMMETLKCLLQMDSFVHTAAGSSLTGDRQYAAQSWLNSQLVCPAGLYLYGNRQ